MKNIEKNQKFSIRKLSIGVFSLCIGSFILGYLPVAATNTKSITVDYVSEQSLSDAEKQKIINALPSDIAGNASYHLVYRINPKMTPQLWLATGALLVASSVLLVLSIKKTNKKALIIGATIVAGAAIAIPLIRLSAIGIKPLQSTTQTLTYEKDKNIVLPDVDQSLYTFVGYLPHIIDNETPKVESQQATTTSSETQTTTISNSEIPETTISDSKQKTTTHSSMQKNTPVDIQKAKSEYEILYNQKILQLETSELTVEEKEEIKNTLALLKQTVLQEYEKAQTTAELSAKQDNATKQLAKNDVSKSAIKSQAISNIEQHYQAKKLEIEHSELTEEEKAPYLETLSATKNNVATITTALNNAEVENYQTTTIEQIQTITVGDSVVKQTAKQLIEEAYQAKLAEIQSSRLLQEEKNDKINDLQQQKNNALQQITTAKHNDVVETHKNSATETMQSLVVGESPIKNRLKRSIDEIYQSKTQKLSESIFTPEQQQTVATTLLEIKTTLERQVDESENIEQISNIENTMLAQLTSVDVGMNKKEALKNQLTALITEIENAGVKYHNYEPTIKTEIDQSLAVTKALLSQEDLSVDALTTALNTMNQYRELLDHPTNNGESRLQSAINNAKAAITDRKDTLLLALQPENFSHLSAGRINEVKATIIAKANELVARVDSNTFNLNADVETFATEAIAQLSIATLEEENTKAGLVREIQALLQEIPTLSAYINASETYKTPMDTLLVSAQQSLSEKNSDALTALKLDLVAKKTALDGEQQLQNNKNDATSALNTAYAEKQAAIQNAPLLTEEKQQALQQLDAIKQRSDEAINNAVNNDTVRSEKETGINQINAIATNASEAKNNAKQAIETAASEKQQSLDNAQLTPEDRVVRQSELDQAKQNALQEIENATNQSQLNTAKETGVNHINQVATTATPLTLAKQSAINEVTAKYNEKAQQLTSSNLTTEERTEKQQELDRIKENALSRIAQTTLENIEQEKTSELQSLTDFAIGNSIQKETATNAVTEAYNRKKSAIESANTLLEEERATALQQLNNMKSEIDGAIQQATTNNNVATEQQNGISRIDAINVNESVAKNNAKQEIEAEAVKKQQAIENAGLTSEDQAVRQEQLNQAKQTAIHEIERANNQEALNTAKENGMNNIRQVDATPTPLTLAKQSAINEVTAKYNEKAQQLTSSNLTTEEKSNKQQILERIKNEAIARIQTANIDAIDNEKTTSVQLLTAEDVTTSSQKNNAKSEITTAYQLKKEAIESANQWLSEERTTALQRLETFKDDSIQAIARATTNHHVTTEKQTGLNNINSIATNESQAKNNAKQEIETAASEKLQAIEAAGLTPEDSAFRKEQLAQAKQNALNAIDVANNQEALSQATQEGKANIASVATTATELTIAKQNATNEITTKYDEKVQQLTRSNLTEEEKTVIQQQLDVIKNEALSRIAQATLETIEQEKTPKIQALNNVEISTSRQKEAAKAELNAAYEEKRTAIQNAQWLAEERDEALQQLAAIKNRRDEAINHATNNDTVRTEKESGINQINAIAVNESQAKTTAKQAIETAVSEKQQAIDAAQLTPEDRIVRQAELNQAKQRALQEIENATNQAQLNTAKENGMSNIRQVNVTPTELTQAKENAKQAILAKYNEKVQLLSNSNLTTEERTEKQQALDRIKESALSQIAQQTTLEHVEQEKTSELQSLSDFTIGNSIQKETATNAVTEAYNRKKSAIESANTLLEEERTTALQQLNSMKSEIDGAIQQANNNNNVEAEKQSGISRIDAINVNESASKNNAKQEIETVASEKQQAITDSQLSTEDKATKQQELVTAKQNAIQAIEQATNQTTLTNALENGKETIRQIETTTQEETCGLQPSEDGPCSLPPTPDTTPAPDNAVDANDPFAPQPEFEAVDLAVKPFLRVKNNKPHTHFIKKINSTTVTYELKEGETQKFVKAKAKLYVNNNEVQSIDILDKNNLTARFTNLANNVDYYIRTELVYRNTQTGEEKTSTINDVVQVDFEKRDLEIKNVDEVELWRVKPGGKRERKLRLRYAIGNALDEHYVVLKSDEHKDIQLPISKISPLPIEIGGKKYYEIEANMRNLVSKTGDSPTYTNNIKFYVQKEEKSNYESSFATLISEMRNSPYGTFKLTQDLSASDATLSDLTYLAQFGGVLDGNGYKIYDLKAPLFKKLTGTVKNLTLPDVEIYQPQTKEIGSLAVEASQNATIQNVKATGTIIAKEYIGGIVGSAYNATLNNVYFKGSLTSVVKTPENNMIGGIAGWVGTNGIIDKAYADVSISATSSNFKIGGLVGQMENANAKILASYATGRINYPITRGVDVGGLVGAVLGDSHIKIKDSISAMNVGIGNKVYGSSEKPQERFENVAVVAGKAIGKDNQKAQEITIEEAQNRLSTTFALAQNTDIGKSTYNKYDVDYQSQDHIRTDRLLAYENMEKLLPFFTRDVIIQHGNRLSNKDSLVKKKLVDVVPLLDNNHTPLFDVMGIEAGENGQNINKINKIKKVLLHFDDGSVEYHYVTKRQNEINGGAIVEYHFVDKNISYTPEVLTFESAYKSLLSELIRTLSTVEWTSNEVNQALNVNAYSPDKESLMLQQSFNEVKNNIEKHLSELISNYNLVGLDSQVGRNQLKNYVINNKAKLLIGLAYMNRWYGIQYNNTNVKDYMMKKADFFGKNINALDQLIRIGELGAETLKPKNTAVVAGHLIAKETVDGDLFTYLEAYRKAFAPKQSNADWFNSATSAKIVETNSKIASVLQKQTNDKNYSNRFYDKLAHPTWRHPEITLLLLNLPKNEKSMYVLTNMTSTAIGSFGKYKSTDNQQVEQALESMAVKMANHSDYWYNILPNDKKDGMFRNVIVWDSFGRNNGRMATELQQFYNPLSLRLDCQEGAGACADHADIYYVGYDLIGEQGETTYTHELVHVLESTYLLDHGRRNGLGPESYALGFLQSLRWHNQDTLGINSIYDHSNKFKQQPGLQLANASPERFKSTQDLETYMRNYFDVLYTLDYLEADAVLNSQNINVKNNWFNKMEVKDNGKNVTEITRVSQHNATTVADLIDSGFVSRRSYDPPGRGAYSYQEIYDAYLEVNAFNPIYGSLNNDGVQRNEYEFRKLAFELLAEYGYARGFVPYASNQYAKELVGAAAGYQAFADSAVIQKITGQYTSSLAFRKAMFERRKNQLNNIRPIEIIGGNNGYYYGETRNVAGIEQLRALMNEAVQYDMTHDKYSKQSLGDHNEKGSRVYRLKAAVLNGFLRATKEFRESIYNNRND